MASALDDYCLVLNSNWQVVRAVQVRTAVEIVMRGRGFVLDPNFNQHDWDAWLLEAPPDYKWIRGVSRQVAAPQVIILALYGGKPPLRVNYSKSAVLHRDNHICQYCNKQLPASALTIDHVVPRSKGGRSDFLNTCAACSPCNTYKADREPVEAGMKLRAQPTIPKFKPHPKIPRGPVKKSWVAFLDKEKIPYEEVEQ